MSIARSWTASWKRPWPAAPAITFEWGGGDLAVNSVVNGRILRVDDDFVLVDVGYKSEGIIPRNEWEEGEEPPKSARSSRS